MPGGPSINNLIGETVIDLDMSAIHHSKSRKGRDDCGGRESPEERELLG